MNAERTFRTSWWASSLVPCASTPPPCQDRILETLRFSVSSRQTRQQARTFKLDVLNAVLHTVYKYRMDIKTQTFIEFFLSVFVSPFVYVATKFFKLQYNPASLEVAWFTFNTYWSWYRVVWWISSSSNQVYFLSSLDQTSSVSRCSQSLRFHLVWRTNLYLTRLSSQSAEC